MKDFKLKNIIFDFDGVIINSRALQKKALKEIYHLYYGPHEPPYEAFFQNSGNSLTNIFKKLKISLDSIALYQKICNENMSMIQLYEDMDKLLIKLKTNEFRCALCTGKERARTIEILNYFNIEPLFNYIVCSDDVVNPKPHNESIVKIMRYWGASSDNTIMIGDSVNDIICAKKAGIRSVAVLWGDTSHNDLLKAVPSYCIANVQELDSFLLSLAS